MEIIKNGKKHIEIFLLVLVLSVTFVVSNQMMYGIIVAKTFAFCIAIVLIIIFMLIQYKEKSLIINLVDISFILYVLYLLIHIISNPYISLYNHKFIEWVGLLILYFFIKKIELNEYKLIILLLIFGSIEAIWGNLQLYDILPSYNQNFKITGSFFNPASYAAFLTFLFPLALSSVLFIDKNDENKIKASLKKIASAYLFFYIIVLPATQSRACWLAFVVSSSMLLFIRFKIANKLKAFLSNSLLRKIIAFVVLFASIILVSITLYRYKPDSVTGRFFIWKNTLSCIKENPIFGKGFDRFSFFYNNEQAKCFLSGKSSMNEINNADFSEYAFNEYLQITAETGIIGLLLSISVIFFAFNCPKIQINWMTNAIKISIIAILVISIFSYPLTILPIKIILVLLLANLSKHNFNCTLKINYPLLYFGFVFLFFINCSYYIIKNQYKAYYDWNNGYKYMMCMANGIAGNYYKKAYPAFKDNGDFLQCYGKSLSIEGKYSESIEILDKSKQYITYPGLYNTLGFNYLKIGKIELAEKYYIFAENIIPNHLYSKYLLVNLYLETKQTAKFKVLANNILNMNIKVQNEAVNQIKSDIKKNLALINEKVN
jgi:O-antigen polymerase